MRRLRRGCARDVTADCVALGALFDGSESDHGYEMLFDGHYPEISLSLCRHACNKRDGHGCYKLAEQMEGKQNHSQEAARKAARVGCPMGSADACYLAAEFYDKYSETPNFEQEVAFREKACRLSSGYGCDQLAGALRDDDDAKTNRRVLACANGDGHGCLVTARYRFDRNTDMRRALYRIGCDEGEEEACTAWKALR